MDHPNNFVSDDSSSMFSGVTLQSILFPPYALLSDPAHSLNESSLVPKCEPPLFEYLPLSPTFFSTFYDPSSSTFLPLPQLHSLDDSSSPSFPPNNKRPRFDSPLISTPNPIPIPDDANNNFLPPSPVIPQSNLARQRRQKLSDKTRCLQKLMPWDKKMDQATLLEEASKYVKFLQAQFNALQSMPSYSYSPPSHSHSQSSLFGDLERLNRNQLLQVLVNSPVAQTRLYSQGFCVFSVEQLTLLTNITGKNSLLLPQLMSHNNASSKSFFN